MRNLAAKKMKKFQIKAQLYKNALYSDENEIVEGATAVVALDEILAVATVRQ